MLFFHILNHLLNDIIYLIFNPNTSKLKELEIEPMTFLLVVIHSIPEQETGA